MTIHQFSLKVILLLAFFVGFLKPSADGQEVLLLYQEVSLAKVDQLQKGYLDIVLPDPSIPSLNIIQIYYSVTPNHQLIEQGILKGRWNARKLIGHTRIDILIVLQLGREDLKMNSNLDFTKADLDNIRSDIEYSWLKCEVTNQGRMQFRQTAKSKGYPVDLSEIHIYKIGKEKLVQEHFDGIRKNQVKEVQHHITNNTLIISNIAANLYQLPDHPHTDYLFRYLTVAQPTNYNHHNFLGVSLARKGDFKQSVIHLRRALSLANNSFEKAHAYYGLANYYALKNEKEKAVNHLKLTKRTEVRFDISATIEDQDFINLKDYAPFLKLMKRKR